MGKQEKAVMRVILGERILLGNVYYIDMIDHQVYVAKESTESVEKILVDNGESMTKWYQVNLLKSIATNIK